MLDVIDARAGGDVGRVVVGGLTAIPGASVAERAAHLRESADGLRHAFMRAPHGDRTHSINLLVPPTAGSGADFGLIVMGTMGYPGFSGSNAMCTIAALDLLGRVPASAEQRGIRIETPIGVTALHVSRAPGEPLHVEYAAPAGRFVAEGLQAPIAGGREIPYDLVDSGVPYVVVDAGAVGLDPREATPELLRPLFDPLLAHASDRGRGTAAARPVTLGLLAEPEPEPGPARAPARAPRAADGSVEANVAVYMAGGVLCAGPTGTGTTALLTWLRARGRIADGDAVRAVSPAGNAFGGTLLRSGGAAEGAEVFTRIVGEPVVLGRSGVALGL